MATKKLTQGEFLTKAVAIHGNKYDYSLVIYINSKTKVKIICPGHGVFNQTPNSHLHGHGCIICAGNRVMTTEEWIKKAVAIHGDKYDYSEVNYFGGDKKVKIKCYIHGIFKQLAANHTNSEAGCPFCAGQRVNEINCLARSHPELASQWHPTKNEDISPDNVVAGSVRKVWWKCPVVDDHEWEASICSRSSDNLGCPCCSGKKVVSSNCLANKCPKLLLEWDYSKNRLSPYDLTCNSNKLVWWKCPVAADHEWRAKPNDRIRKGRCPFCTNKRVAKSNCLATTHPNLAEQWSTKNKNLTPYDVICGSKRKVWWKCSLADDHEWQTTLQKRTREEQNCPFCNESKGEKEIVDVLDRLGLKFKRQVRFKTCRDKRILPFDFLINLSDDADALIEYHGRQHYEPVRWSNDMDDEKIALNFNQIKSRDRIKELWAKKEGIPLMIIPHWDKDKILELIKIFLKNIVVAQKII